MVKYFPNSSWYSLELPQGWVSEAGENNTAFYDEINGVGAIQITAYSFPKNARPIPEPRRELIEYLQTQNASGWNSKDIKDHITDKAKIASCEFEDQSERKFWKVQINIANNKLIFITYNCDVNDQTIEIKLVETILDSLEIY
ncbi:MAG: hypothetical protein AAFP70_07995 [Calditrichota bacterium]